MKKEIHPEYREVVFQDISTDFAFLTRSCVDTSETITWEDGKEYPLVKVEVSSRSHPFFTGKQRVVQSGGQVDRFHKRFGITRGSSSAQ
ncbi:type B 50S ribosomal protein L31 [Halorhodospira halochloris]|nr:type B 50S ribosomal protein L31 [Halorhodospira halochloris]MBK1650633.1 50S ribosomal protein L31 [Halorhodospira halochloris]MCG5529741.1 type B 50S ribosomal protein L31 [Halorhodospira halochloris]MCG5549050.1 type B 50S ribosomal protein L31 [Halorhodospira halochloris]